MKMSVRGIIVSFLSRCSSQFMAPGKMYTSVKKRHFTAGREFLAIRCEGERTVIVLRLKGA
jgi:hypothetical protein